MATRRRYTAKQKAEAVGIAVVEGVTAAERSTGIPKQTIHYWTEQPEFGQFRTTARETVIDSLWIGVQIGARELVAGLQGDAPLHHKAAAWQALTDRYLLLSGEATSRSEHRDISDPDESGLDALEQVVAAHGPWQVPVAVESRRNGTGTNGRH